MIQSYVYQKSVRALGRCHLGMFNRMNMVFKIDLIKIKPDINEQ